MGAPEAFTTTSDIGHWIGGQRRAGISGRSQAVFNPATGKGDRVGIKTLEDGKKVRFFKSNGEMVKA